MVMVMEQMEMEKKYEKQLMEETDNKKEGGGTLSSDLYEMAVKTIFNLKRIIIETNDQL